nr:hypothetical protein [uncultured Campylobacter sp.]
MRVLYDKICVFAINLKGLLGQGFKLALNFSFSQNPSKKKKRPSNYHLQKDMRALRAKTQSPISICKNGLRKLLKNI